MQKSHCKSLYLNVETGNLYSDSPYNLMDTFRVISF